jgi:hypothetical protein
VGAALMFAPRPHAAQKLRSLVASTTQIPL